MATESVDVTSEMFGRGVALFRVESGMSQRDLAEKLRARGLTFDTAAISRIESGKRSVRLSEAVTLASVLGVPLEVLVSGGRESPAAAYERAQSRADQALVDLRRTFIDAASKHLQVTGLLGRHPEMLPRMHAPNVQSADDYLAYVADVRQRIEEQLRLQDPLDNGRYVVVPTERERQDLVRLALAIIETSIVTREEVQAHRGETSDTAE